MLDYINGTYCVLYNLISFSGTELNHNVCEYVHRRVRDDGGSGSGGSGPFFEN